MQVNRWVVVVILDTGCVINAKSSYDNAYNYAITWLNSEAFPTVEQVKIIDVISEEVYQPTLLARNLRPAINPDPPVAKSSIPNKGFI